MGRRKLTPAEERAYSALARAARRLREAQEAAGRQRETKGRKHSRLEREAVHA